MVYELQYINRTILFKKSNTGTHRNHVNRERKKQGEEIPLSHTHTFNSRTRPVTMQRIQSTPIRGNK